MENKADGVCAVIVTYGNRFHLLKQVIDGCLRNNVKKIIIVDNASEKASKDQLMKMLLELKDKLKVISLEENLGSAGGYKKGLEYAYSCPECEFIWLLDDDNVPEDEALKTLLHFYQNLTYPNKEYKVALASFRESHKHYKEAIMKNKPDLILGKKNSFLGFYIFELPQKLLLKFLKVLFGIKLPIKEDLSKKAVKF